jgi:hypothetical protein
MNRSRFLPCALSSAILLSGSLAVADEPAVQVQVQVNAPPVDPPPPPPAPPPPPPESPPPPPAADVVIARVSGGLDMGYGVPAGNFSQGTGLSNIAAGLWMLQGDLDFLVSSHVIVGADAGFGVATTGTQLAQTCDALSLSCTVFDFDVGLHGEYLFLPVTAPITPWTRLGLAWEVLSVSEGSSDGSSTASVSANGPALDLSGGLDFNLPHLQIGPFAALRVGRYTSVTESDNSGDSNSSDITSPDWHEWVMLGVHGRWWPSARN